MSLHPFENPSVWVCEHGGREPVSPRRWTVVAPTEELAVREDIITPEDVEAVGKYLADLALDRGDASAEYTSGYEDEARLLLALVLGSDKEGEDGD